MMTVGLDESPPASTTSVKCAASSAASQLGVSNFAWSKEILSVGYFVTASKAITQRGFNLIVKVVCFV
jgi:hypothetical protein